MKRKIFKKPPTKQQRQLIRQIQALPPMDESRERVNYERVVNEVLG
ncbi:hypothetical protein BN8_02896 [Fibrisoma limi BUZ 3]|uniref:Uncharacterized protein n=1 Tax=Fibrisoma limi BUZ 3 TaxID=1185876 RepID=I2GIP9_9BACT|nr:hypothetical protein [Fibrisoma limi]CCH53774.1 hypothetical protein BN8_02896 [Fibrisoma limi BUZ 3]